MIDGDHAMAVPTTATVPSSHLALFGFETPARKRQHELNRCPSLDLIPANTSNSEAQQNYSENDDDGKKRKMTIPTPKIEVTSQDASSFSEEPIALLMVRWKFLMYR